jgi:hypothetical protein
MTSTRALVNSLGTSDKVMSGNPNMTYFREVFAKRSQFGEQINTIEFPKELVYDSEIAVDLHRECDVVTGVYLRIDLPISTVTVVNSAGTYLMEWAQLEIGDQRLERLHGEYIEIRQDLRVIESKQAALTRLTGKNTTNSRTIYFVKLNFNIFNTGLPVCALDQNPRIRFKFRRLNEIAPSLTVTGLLRASLLVTSIYLPAPERDFFMQNELTYLLEQTQRHVAAVPVIPLTTTLKPFNVGSSIGFGTGVTSGTYTFNFTVPNDWSAWRNTSLSFTFYTVSSPVGGGGTYTLTVGGVLQTVTTTTGSNTVTLTTTTAPTVTAGATVSVVGTFATAPSINRVSWAISSIYVPLVTQPVTYYTEFINPVKEMHFVIQNTNAVPYDYTADGTTDQLVSMRMLFNGTEVLTDDMTTPLFLRVLQGLENHNRCPDRFFYTYCFALDPENKQPTGSVNMTQIRRQQFDFTLRYLAIARTLRIYARSYNVLKIQDGKARLLFNTIEDTGSLPAET